MLNFTLFDSGLAALLGLGVLPYVWQETDYTH